jgi:signal transduction histidine kinase
VTVKASEIRAERFAEIGAVVRRDAGEMIRRWAERAAEEQPAARRVHHAALLDHLPQVLADVATALEESDPDAAPQRRTAARHGLQRWEVGWSPAEVVRDYRTLRLVVLEHLDEALDRPLRLNEVQAIGLALDEAAEASVERYARERDEQAGRLEASLRDQAEALKEADRRKNEFMATLAHELRNPLAPLRNCLEIARLSGDSPEAIGKLREVMERQIGQMARLVDDLLDASRIAQGKLELRRLRTDLREAVELAVQANAPLREARRHKLTASLPAEALHVEGDQARLVQVVVNLLNNAVKYTPEGGHVRVEAEREGGEAVLRVSDDGEGIRADMLERIFELGEQLGVGADRSHGGLGIGLTLVRRLVELHGGTVRAASDGPGKGSTFTVRLPAN